MSPASAPQVEPENDTEITLGTGKMLILFFGLVILCALFFGMGFTMGRNSVRSAPELLAIPTGTRPSALDKNGTQAAPSTQIAPSQPAPQPSAASPSPPSEASSGSNTAAANTNGAPTGQSGSQAPSAQASAASGPGYVVQVAAVSKQEDAEALVDALKTHQYSAFVSNTAGDKLFHVQVGPFTDIKDAEAVRAKLVSDGYNPILKK